MIRRLVAGEQLQGIHTDSWNAFADAAEFVQGLETPAATPEAMRRPPLRVQLNADREAFHVVALTEPMTTIEENDAAPFRGPPVLKSTAPATGKRWAVLQKGGIDTQIVPAIVVGLSWVKVDVQDEADTTAGFVAGDADKLKSGLGGATIIWKESGTGVKWAIVLLTGSGDGEISPAKYVTVKLLQDTPAKVSDTEAGVGGNATARIVQICTPRRADNPIQPVTIDGIDYDFTGKMVGDIVEPVTPADGNVNLVNVSSSILNFLASPTLYWHAKLLGEGNTPETDDPLYEAIAPTELRTLTGWSGSLDMSIGADASVNSDEIRFQEDGACE